MPAYMHGSLAVEQRTTTKNQVKVNLNEPSKPAVRAKVGLPVQEKLLYLFTVAICVVVAGLIIWRYAQIYEMNTNIMKIEQQLKKLEAENSVLKRKVETLSSPERFEQEAKKYGYTVPDEKQIKAAGPAKTNAPGTGSQGIAPGSTASAKKTKEQP
ncbi:cell division protein FtsL [Paenibacillus cremeus]|uniref:Cell division protein FtsL n=1 Tax=Paenibacillus cremeus TaxID=2163881 RepID=A0A559KBX8_9BACL|nr:cell division protein FtsL [Paenibacillus cremeus]TVY09603.1 cell division protein FtsL [Paenibacillus cremeus]